MVEIRREPGPGSKQLEILVRGLGQAEARVGWFETAKYEDGTPVALAAIVNEFGYPPKKIPPRSFFRTTILEKHKKWSQTIKEGSQLVILGKQPASSVMGLLAFQATGDVRKKITQIWTPPLRPGTIKNRIRRTRAYEKLKTRKGKAAHVNRRFAKAPRSLTKPLVDSGDMLDFLTYDLGKKS